jgi:ABC-type nitrate/sulfonate/bicarbonate transport system ATPase subunit
VLLRVCVKNKAYGGAGQSVPVLRDLEFEARPGSVTCLYGSSGCGKSTLLRILSGLDEDYEGEVLLDGVQVTKPTREIGLTVQQAASFDWLTVAENISFALRYDRTLAGSWIRRLFGLTDRQRARAEAERMAELVGLAPVDLDKYPEQVSGGMKQRMAFGRALLPNPKVLLLDEPFSSLDYESRRSLQDVVLRARRIFNIAFVCVSHDPEEVLYLADEVIVLGGTPATVVHRFAPALPAHGAADSLYTPEFQQAKKELRGWLTREPQNKCLNPTTQNSLIFSSRGPVG